MRVHFGSRVIVGNTWWDFVCLPLWKGICSGCSLSFQFVMSVTVIVFSGVFEETEYGVLNCFLKRSVVNLVSRVL